MKEFMDIGIEAAYAGGKILNEMSGNFTTREKAPKDLVTDADIKSQRTIESIIKRAFPDHDFVGEEQTGATESRHVAGRKSDFCWVVDPLDGTMNYAHQLPGYAVSIALRQGDRLLVGVVYDPVTDECFTATAGAGAQLNGKPIHPSECNSLDEGLIAVSLPSEFPRGSLEIARLIEVLHGAQAIRRLGSAALNLSYLAMGRLDGYWATAVKPWDVAAGALIVMEAGAVITDFRGGPFLLDNPPFAAAATPAVHRELLAALARVEQ